MRRALRPRPIGSQRSNGDSIPAPVAGWDAVSELASMPLDRAIILDNFFPEPDRIMLRRGFAEYATGIGSSAVETLMEWSDPSSQKLFAAGNGAVYDVSTSGAVGAAVVSGLKSTRFQHVMFSNAGGPFLYMANGKDAARHYNGTSWATPTINNVSSSSLINVHQHKNRIWLVEKDSLSAWYLPVSAIAGAATELDIGPLCELGGSLQAIGTLTRDGGDGPDDLLVLMTSKGEVVIYQGTDPASATTWSMVGRFHIGAPIGRRCMIKVGGDLVVITQDGFVPLLQVLAADRAATQRFSLSANIDPVVTEQARSKASLFGWEALSYPKGNMAVFNVPQTENSEIHQYVMNVLTGAWCRFTGQNANCWALYQDDLYFGGIEGNVYRADTGQSDNGFFIKGDLKTAFNYFRRRGMLKKFNLTRPLMYSGGDIHPAIEINVDFDESAPTAIPSSIGVSGDQWDVGKWDIAQWGSGDDQIIRNWVSTPGLGYAGAIRMAVSTKTLSLKIASFDVIFEPGALV